MIHFSQSTKIHQTSHHANDAHQTMSQICGTHQLSTRAKHSLDFQYQGIMLPFHCIKVGTIQYGARVEIGVANLKSYSISLPYIGKQCLNKAGVTYHSDTDNAVIVSNSEEQSLVITQNCQKFQLVIPETTLRQTLVTLIDQRVTEPIVFDPYMPVKNHINNQLWWQNVQFFIQSQRQSNNNIGFWGEDYEKFLIKSLLMSQTHNYSDQLYSLKQKIPAYLVDIKAFIIRHAKDNLSIETICHQSPVSKSKLYAQFQAYYGTSPMNFLKAYRLEQIHYSLIHTTDQKLSISKLAYEWGFNHLGRFSQDYKDKYGETPSETLQRIL